MPRGPTTTLALAAISALAILAPRPARAETPLPDLLVHRTEDTAGCPDSAALAARIDRHMKRTAVRPRTDAGTLGKDRPSLDVQIYRSEAGFTAIVQTGEKTRQITDNGATCRGLADALAITLAILLDTEVPPPAPEPTPPPELPPAVPSPSSAPATPPVDATPTPAPAPPEPAPIEPFPLPPRTFRVVAGGGATAATGLLTRLALGATGHVGLGIGRVFSVEAGFLVLPTQTVPYAGKVKGAPASATPTIDLQLTSALFRLCATARLVSEDTRAGLCAGALIGTIRGEGRGFVTNQSATDPWIAGNLGAIVEQTLFWRLSLVTRAQVYIPILRRSFTVDNVDAASDPQAFSPASVGAGLDAELRLSIW
ncbi:MAG: hypothetical protein ABJE95_17930 [Byssovorax sp.]